MYNSRLKFSIVLDADFGARGSPFCYVARSHTVELLRLRLSLERTPQSSPYQQRQTNKYIEPLRLKLSVACLFDH